MLVSVIQLIAIDAALLNFNGFKSLAIENVMEIARFKCAINDLRHKDEKQRKMLAESFEITFDDNSNIPQGERARDFEIAFTQYVTEPTFEVPCLSRNTVEALIYQLANDDRDSENRLNHIAALYALMSKDANY